jgi:hypothetical protein
MTSGFEEKEGSECVKNACDGKRVSRSGRVNNTDR